MIFYDLLIFLKEIDNRKENLSRLESLLAIGRARLQTDMITGLELDRLLVSKTKIETKLERQFKKQQLKQARKDLERTHTLALHEALTGRELEDMYECVICKKRFIRNRIIGLKRGGVNTDRTKFS